MGSPYFNSFANLLNFSWNDTFVYFSLVFMHTSLVVEHQFHFAVFQLSIFVCNDAVVDTWNVPYLIYYQIWKRKESFRYQIASKWRHNTLNFNLNIRNFIKNTQSNTVSEVLKSECVVAWAIIRSVFSSVLIWYQLWQNNDTLALKRVIFYHQ